MKPPPITSRLDRVAVCLMLAVLLAVTATVRGQVLEEWRGNRRKTDPAAPLAPVPSPPVYPTPLPEPRGITLPALPPSSRPAPPVVQASATVPAPGGPTSPADLERLGRSAGELLGELCTAIDTYRATVRSGRERMQAAADAIRLMPTSPREVRLVPVPREPAPRRKAESARPTTSNGGMWAQLGLIGLAMLVCPLLVSMLVVMMLRRSGLQMRVEVNNPTGTGPIVARVEPPGGDTSTR